MILLGFMTWEPSLRCSIKWSSLLSFGNKSHRRRPGELLILLPNYPERKDKGLIAIIEQASSPAYRNARGRRNRWGAMDQRRSTQNLKIGSKLAPGLWHRLIYFFRSNSDCSAWSHVDIPGINPEIIVQKLQVDPLHQPVRQKGRKFTPETCWTSGS